MITSLSSIASKEERKILERLVYYATKAPSGHNTQPWKFRLRENEIEIHPDFSRALPVVDPDHRELYISLGCAVENLLVAAPRFGRSAGWEAIRAKDGHYFIRVSLKDVEELGRSPIFDNVEKRQTNRRVYEDKMIPEEEIRQLADIPGEEGVQARFFRKGTVPFDTLREYILRGNAIQMEDQAFKDELLSWIRFNGWQVRKTGDGLAHKVMGFPPTPQFLGKMIVRAFLKPKAQNKADKEKIDSSSHFVLLTTEHNTIPEWIALGVYLERLLLHFTKRGIASAYMNPPCELPELAAELQEEPFVKGEYPTLILRIGYAEPMPYAPRREVEDVLITK